MSDTRLKSPTAAGRRAGRFETLTGATANDHGCWAYTSDSERAETVVAWLADGLRIGQRAVYVYDGADELHPDTGLAELAPLNPQPLIDRGALQVASSTQLYDYSTPIDAANQLRMYAAAVEQACADGFNGLRVAADITPLVADPTRRAAHVRWEQVADRYITNHPLAPLCLYDTRQVADIDAIVSAHPLQGPRRAPFALYGAGPRRAMLAGEIDATADKTLTDLLRSLPPEDAELDLSRVAFVDGHAAWQLHEELRARRAAGQELALVAASPLLRRVWSLCGFDSLLLAA